MIGRLASAVALTLARACGWFKYCRVRMIVEVDTPEGVRSGAGILEIRGGRNFLAILPDELKFFSALIGEAIPIDVSNGETVFALLRLAKSHHEMLGRIVGALDQDYRGGGESFLASLRRLSARAMIGQSAALPSESWPLLVSFRDPAVPASVERPKASVQIRAVHLEVTNARVTTGIERRLAWVDGFPGHLGGAKIIRDRSLANNLTAADFKMGL
jgi:hypothetical protein